MLFFAVLIAAALADDTFNVVFQNSDGCCQNNNNPPNYNNAVCSHWAGIAPKTSGFADRLLCKNGETCSVRDALVWDCCNSRGGRAACPATHPFLCGGAMDCGNNENCCSPECPFVGRPLMACGNTPQPLNVIYYTRNNGADCPVSRNGCVAVQAAIDSLWATCPWTSMTTFNRILWNSAFNYDEGSFSLPNSYSPTSRVKNTESSKTWNALTAEQRAAAVCLGYGQATWDAAI
eukprot:NODE_4248_length_818_cov_363.659913_g4090_i0.p1 GENE.NODE_4248_length_818_cov_363.659913_g4090_i0~~NODE_4248_length_818_cov_363.659913_g4090_i0.p1  ORF type:complete len:254 (+),score=50.15 NODE_4248_length_818_cov_363.659913_g4090_i0:61-762(+)